MSKERRVLTFSLPPYIWDAWHRFCNKHHTLSKKQLTRLFFVQGLRDQEVTKKAKDEKDFVGSDLL